MDGQLNKQWLINTDGNKLDSKNGMSLDDVINLKHQGVGQKMTTGWHNHQGVSETPKSANVICEQPLILPLST